MEEITVTVVGCGDAFASGKHLHTCFHIEMPRSGLLLDCGATAYYGLKKREIDIGGIDTVVISHFHGDHYGGLPFLLLDAAIHRRDAPLTIVSPPTGKERISRLLEQLYPGSDVLNKLNLSFKTYIPNVVESNGWMVEALPVVHTPETLPHGVRIKAGNKVISYSGDTAWTPALIELADGADLFICECNFFDSAVEGHLNYKTFRAHDSELRYKRLILTHLGSEMLANLGRVEHPYATDGLKIVL